MISTIGRWNIEHQPDETRQCYQARPEGAGCDCADCRNFLAAIDRVSCPEFRAIADLLAVELRKPAELCHYGRGDSGLHNTHGWCHVVGRIISGRDAMKQTHENAGVYEWERLPDGVEFGFTNNLAMVPEPFSGKLLIQLEFIMNVPWVLPELESP